MTARRLTAASWFELTTALLGEPEPGKGAELVAWVG